MKKIIVLCTGNSCRSQMAEGYLKKYLRNKAEIFSAGTKNHHINQKAVEIMMDDGIDISSQTSNNVLEYSNINFDYVITVCDHANETCPTIFAKKAVRIHHNFFHKSNIYLIFSNITLDRLTLLSYVHPAICGVIITFLEFFK